MYVSKKDLQPIAILALSCVWSNTDYFRIVYGSDMHLLCVCHLDLMHYSEDKNTV